MPVAHDETRWMQNDDGTWVRRVGGVEQTAPANATQGALEAADELGVDISAVEGSGAEGRITKADVEKAANA